MNDAGVLSRREVRLLPDTAREEIAPAVSGQVRQPLADRGSSLLGDFELDRATGLLRDDDLSYGIRIGEVRILLPTPAMIIVGVTPSLPVI